MVESALRLPTRILVVEDEIDISTSLSYSLRACGYEVEAADCGEAAINGMLRFHPELVVLDVGLPDMSGFEVCRRIRTSFEDQPAVVMLTARTQELDRVAGFEVGADDYVTKPFNIRELMLRIEARLKARRPAHSDSATQHKDTPKEDSEKVTVGPVVIDKTEHRVFVDGAEIHVSALEMRLLLFLVRTPGKMRTRKELLTEVWGYHPEVLSRTLDTHIKRIRDKFGEAGDVIQTVRGVGYRLAVPSDHDDPGKG